jgi:hypothetical protein
MGFGKLLHFFNIGDVPFMIILSFLSLSMWAGSIAFNRYTGNTSPLVALGFFVPLLIVSLFLTKFCSAPFVKLFTVLNKDIDKNVVGLRCIVKVGALENRIGQAEIETEEFHQLINIKSIEQHRLIKGEEVLIIDYNKDEHYYLVEPS